MSRRESDPIGAAPAWPPQSWRNQLDRRKVRAKPRVWIGRRMTAACAPM